MKKILLSVLTIGLVAGAVVGATNAYFTGGDSSKDNSITTGSLMIDIDESVGGSLPFNVSNAYPGWSRVERGAVVNSGTLSFNWTFSIDKTADVPGPGLGSLHNVLKSRIYMADATVVGGQATCPGEPTCVVNGQTLDCTSVPAAWGTPIWEGWMTEGTYPDKMGKLDPGKGVCFTLVPYLQSDLYSKDGNATDNAYQMSNATYELKTNAYQLGDPAY